MRRRVVAKLLAFLGVLGMSGFACGDRSGPLEGTLRETLRIDRKTAPDLGRIDGLAVAENGRIAVRQVDDYGIRFFAPDGRELGIFGGKGERPGEFAYVGQLSWLGDTLLAFDPLLHRVTLISPLRTSPLRTSVRIIRLPEVVRPPRVDSERIPEFRFAFPFGLRPDRSIVTWVMALGSAGGEVTEVYRRNAAVATARLDGSLERIVALEPLDRGVEWQVEGRFRASEGQPFPNVSKHALAPGLARLAVVRVSLDDPGATRLEVTVIHLDGDTIFARGYPVEAQPLPRRMADSIVAARARHLDEVYPGFAARYVREARVPAAYPPLRNVVFAREGSLWIQLRSREDSSYCLVLTPEGAVRGRLSMPARTTLAAAAGHRIWTLQVDEHRMESVVRFEVSWQPARRD